MCSKLPQFSYQVHDIILLFFCLHIWVLSALSSEEERLWSTVKANSLDFSSWTALIDETEKLAEVSCSCYDHPF